MKRASGIGKILLRIRKDLLEYFLEKAYFNKQYGKKRDSLNAKEIKEEFRRRYAKVRRNCNFQYIQTLIAKLGISFSMKIFYLLCLIKINITDSNTISDK
ncbi:hypothetical protein [Paracerasibacillus soli]|uniref:Transposase n=1 Tax=Paracerasibacillus soli TaxID=480284 RepID=A0ABU5CNP6_9BACI|nr:hypothetical protein [Virgibacillus soli]MDY0407429.1 hypothetical protein [Virgibacillus soli]